MASFKHIALPLVVFALVTLQFAQESSAPTTPAPSTGATQSQPDSKDSKNSKDKKRDKKKSKSDNSPADAYDTAVFSDQVANNVLNDIRDGLEAHSQRLMLSAFDGDKMDGYLTFEDQIQSYFEHYEGFRVHFRIIQTSIEASRGIVLAEFEIEGSPRGGGPVMRRSNQIRFELERGKKGWKVVDFRPRAFFA
jgi:hypothetical protein